MANNKKNIVFFLKKGLNFSLYFFLLILPLQTRYIIKSGVLGTGYSEYGTVSLYASDIVLAVVILFAIFLAVVGFLKRNDTQKNERPAVINKLLLFLIAGLLLFASLSVIPAQDKGLALFKLAWLFGGLALFWVTAFFPYNKLKFLAAFLTGLAFEAGLGMWQFVTQSSFQSKWLGMALHNASELGTSVIEVYIPGELPERWLRAYGGLDHPNILGGALAIAGLLAVYWMANHPNAEKKAGMYLKNIFLALYLVIISGLFFSFSRAAWLGFGIGLAGFLLIAVLSKNLVRQRELLKILLVSGVLVFCFYRLYPDLVATRAAGNTRLEAMSSDERMASDQEALGIIRHNPVLGVGIGNYVNYSFKTAEKSAAKGKDLAISAEWQPAHNAFLLLGAEIGLIGLVVALAIGIYLLYLARGKSKPILAILACFLILTLFDHWLWSLHFGMFFTWVILGFAVKLSAAESLP
ncbi:MAG: O-antigen ligase family protein, partial [Patescibacteria group bacterium]